MTRLEAVRRRYLDFAEKECSGYSPLYERLARGVAEHESITQFVAERRVTQPNLLFAAVQFLVGADRMPAGATELAAVLVARGPQVAELMDRRRTQTNEVGRCAVLLPALPKGPLALVEVGASAGLCLLLDRYFYDYGGVQLGDSASPVRLACSVDGDLPAVSAPEVVWRRGLDIEPVDVFDGDATRWLSACVWADHAQRRQRLEAALELARADPPVVVRGDLVEGLEPLTREAPADACLVVLQSAVFPYLSEDRRVAFAAALAKASDARAVVWISNEAPGLVAGLEPPSPPKGPSRFVLARTTFERRASTSEILALAHPHGDALSWLEATS